MKTILALFTAGSLAFAANAQTTPNHTPPAEKKTSQQQTGTTSAPLMMNDSTARVLGLTPEQMAGWKERGTKYDGQYRTLKPGGTYEQDHQAWIDRRDTDLKGYLTPAQYEKWTTMNKTHMAPRNTTGTRTTQPPPSPAPSQPAR